MTTQRPSTNALHLAVVDHYFGMREHVYDAVDEAPGPLGLPLSELVRREGVRVTAMNWDSWLQYERQAGSFLDWMPFPTTRPAEAFPSRVSSSVPQDSGMTVHRIEARDPDSGLPFTAGLSPRTYGLLADSDPLFLMSYVLSQQLEELHRRDPISAVLVPMFGGLGYVAQLARATGASLRDVPFGVVVTDTSLRRQSANAEGLWTRPAITRRQMEDLSLALADLAVVFGPRGEELVRNGRCGEASVLAPRHVSMETVHALREAASIRATPSGTALNFFVDAPQQGSAGSLRMLDAARLLSERKVPLERPIGCTGTDMSFGPAKPGSFRGYWSARAWVRSLEQEGYWRWTANPRAEAACNVRVYSTVFDPLPQVWQELARGSFVVLSDAAAEGLGSTVTLPALARLGEDPTAEDIADRIAALQALGAEKVEVLRSDLCQTLAAALESPQRERELTDFFAAMANLLAGRCPTPRLGEAARLLLNRKLPLARISSTRIEVEDSFPNTLTAVVTCFEMGELVIEAVESIWSSTRMPDQIILVDDGSTGEATRQAIAHLESESARRKLPLEILRQENQGLCNARNRALAQARSTYISFLDGDDLINQDFYGLALDVFARTPELGGVAAWAEIFGEAVPDGFWNAPQAELPLLLVENTVIVPCVMPTALLRSLGGYDVRQRYNYEDWELAVRLLEAGRPIITIPRYLQRYRVRADSLLRTMSDVQNQVMREQFFASHQELCAQFAPEIALQIEHRLFLRSAASATSPAGWRLNALKALKRLRETAARARAKAV